MGIFEKFKSGFKKSAEAFSSGLKEIVIKKEINCLLYTSDAADEL